MDIRIEKSYKINIKKLLSGFLLILCLLSTNTVYSASMSFNYRLPELSALMSCLLAIYSLKKAKFGIVKKWLNFVVIYLFLNVGIIFAIVPSDRITFYVYRFVVFVPMLTLCIITEAPKGKLFEVAIQYENIVVFYSIVTLVLWALISFTHVLPATGSMTVSWGGIVNYPMYFGVLGTRQRQSFLGITWIRNQGWYTEGPMFSLVILIAICVEVYISAMEQKKGRGYFMGINVKKLIILVLAEISTFTIIGMIALLSIFVFKYCLIKNKTGLGSFMKWTGAIIVIAVTLFVAYSLFLLKADTGSWEVRSDDYLAGFAAWKEHLIVGNGFGHMDAIESHMNSIRFYNKGYSSGIFVILAQGGLLFFLNYIMAFGGYIKRAVRTSRCELLAMLIIVIFLLITTVFHYTFVMMMLLSYGYAFWIEKEHI